MIELRSISAAAGKFNLSNISITINSGDCHIVVGPTGAGKTFLLETLIGLRVPLSGNILINGADVSRFPPNDRNISYVPQDTCLFPNMTVQENIWYGLHIRGLPEAPTKPFIDRLIAFLQISHLLSRYPQNLSGGEKQRVALVRALAIRPQLLVLDEPFSAIDHSMREEVRRLIKELLEEFKTTTLIVTHDLDEAYFLGHQISIIHDGKIIQSGPREEIYYYPKSLVAASFLGFKNIFPARVVEALEDQVSLSCETFNRTFQVACKCGRKRFAKDQKIFFGIRSEAVFILRPGNHQETKACVLEAVVKEIYVRGKMHTILARLAASETVVVEIDIHDVAVRKLGITENATITISLNPKYIFLLPSSDE